ncbi:ribonuclease H-like domain-containing protein [Tanacetum coccineum]
MVEVPINSLDAGNPLYLQYNDHFNLPIVGFKLTGSDNYKMWSTAMKIALKGKNKMGFIDGSCVKPVTSVVFVQQWERCNVIILGWILGCNLLARDPLPDVKDAFAIVSREESHKGLAPGKLSTKSLAAFVVRTNNERCYELNGFPASFKRNPNLPKQSGFVKKFSGNNVDVSQTASISSGSMSASFTNEQMVKLLSLINEKLNANVSCSMTNAYMYNVTLGWIIASGANQNMIVFTKNMFNVVDISSLRLTVGHPNGTMAKITAIGSLKLTENVVLFDVLMVPEYNDLKLQKIMGTGSESGGLYMFDCDNSGKSTVGMCNSGFVCYVSKELWHSRLGHPVDQVLSVLSDKIGFKSGDHVSAYDICHRAKHIRKHFPLSDHMSSSLADLIHLDVWGPYKVTSKDGYKYFLTVVEDFNIAV